MKQTILILLSVLWITRLNSQTLLTVDPAKEYQTMIGFGGTGDYDDVSSQKALLDLCGLSIVRYHIDHDNVPKAADSHIKMADIINGTVPFYQVNAKQTAWFNAMKARGCSTIIATEWSPPACLKKSQCVQQSVPAVVGGPVICGQACIMPVCQYNYGDTTNYLLPQYYGLYARYLKLWVKYFTNASGMSVTGLSLQNEPMFNEPYMSSLMPPSTYGPCLKHVYDTFQADPATKNIILFGPEHMVANGNDTYYSALIDNPTYGNMLGAWAGHGYFDGMVSDLGSSAVWDAVYKKVVVGKGKLNWMTETGGEFDEWQAGLGYIKSMFIAIKYGKVSLWTIYGLGALYQTMPKRSLYNHMHFYRFVRPGAKMIDVTDTDNDVEAIAFKKGSDYTVIVVNMSKTATKTIQLSNFAGKPAFFHLYRSSKNEMCSYVGKISDNNFVLDPECAATITYNATTPNEVYGPMPPQNLVTTSVTDNSISVSWSPASSWMLNGSSVSISGYIVFIDGVKKTPDGPTTKTTWTFTGLKPGTTHLIEIHTRDAMVNQSAVSKLSVTTTCTTGTCAPIDGLYSEELKLSVSPNPAVNMISVDLPGNTVYDLSIIDISGKVVLNEVITSANSLVDVSSLQAGLYIVSAKSKDKVYMTKIVKE